MMGTPQYTREDLYSLTYSSGTNTRGVGSCYRSQPAAGS
jgi:hypothetical protein